MPFAGGIAAITERIKLLLAVRCGEMWPPQLARQLAGLDEMLDGRLTINIISSDLPGTQLASDPRYGRTLEVMTILRTLLAGSPIDHHGEFYEVTLDAPRIAVDRAAARSGRAAGHAAALFRWTLRAGTQGGSAGGRRVPDVARHDAGDRGDHRRHARARGAPRAHTALRVPHARRRPRHRERREPRPPACCRTRRGRGRSDPQPFARHELDRRVTTGRLRDSADDDGYIEEHLWTGIARAR